MPNLGGVICYITHSYNNIRCELIISMKVSLLYVFFLLRASFLFFFWFNRRLFGHIHQRFNLLFTVLQAEISVNVSSTARHVSLPTKGIAANMVVSERDTSITFRRNHVLFVMQTTMPKMRSFAMLWKALKQLRAGTNQRLSRRLCYCPLRFTIIQGMKFASASGSSS